MDNRSIVVCVYADVLSKKEGELKALSDKLHATNGKLFECRNRIQQLHQELKNAHKVTVSAYPCIFIKYLGVLFLVKIQLGSIFIGLNM